MRTIIYQILPRLFGNDNCHCISNGSITENGCGKMNDITTKALEEIKKLGVSHVWYTGLLEHATQTDYSSYGIPKDHPAMVKGIAGSPYAVKDYYDIDPDLASAPTRRFREFRNLVNRTHRAGLKVIMDFVPNHVAREYCSDNTPLGTAQFGEHDNTNVHFSPANNFYYLDAPLQCQFDMQGNTPVPYQEFPAKVTGNDCFTPSPTINDWYETVKLNYGVDYTHNGSKHFSPTPDTWVKMRDILLFWASQGIDGFRCDMAEMVPCEFWSWVIPVIKEKNPDILFIAEVYNPQLYRDYIYRGHFDYLYDKVGLYDTLRHITCGYAPASSITSCWQSIDDIIGHMLNFLENHDEQRIASRFFAGDGNKALPALIVSSCINTQPFMLYCGQELGETGMDEEGFSGLDGRTTIFDYWSVKTIREWRAGGNFDDSRISASSRNLLQRYRTVLNLSKNEKALSMGRFFDLMYVNTDNPQFNPDNTYAFIRSYQNEHILIAVNFDSHDVTQVINIPQLAFDTMGIARTVYAAVDLLTGDTCDIDLTQQMSCKVNIPAYSSIILKFK